MRGHAVVGEQGVQERARERTLVGEAPVLRISGVEMLPTLTTWGQPVRKSSTQLHRVSSLMMSLEGTMVLNAEL